MNQGTAVQSLYIHWPFCPYKCHFCPFVAYAGKDHLMERYHGALMKEIEIFASSLMSKVPLETIYIGGGTPSTYPNNLLAELFEKLNRLFGITAEQEITMEVNPGTVKAEHLALWQSLGINRLSIGVQSLNDQVLHNLNRKQTVHDVYGLIEKAHLYMKNVSIDLIIGLPGISESAWKETIYQITQWPITHLSVYFLTIHEGTALQVRVKKQEVTLPVDEAVVDLYCWTVDHLVEHGFEQYEISNFGKNGAKSKHNSVYWARKPYKGLGVGACSFDGAVRSQHVKDLVTYISLMEEGGSINEMCEVLTDDQILLETVMLGLRQAKGISPDILYPAAHGDHVKRGKLDQTLKDLVAAKYVTHCGDRIVLTPLGLAVENEIIVRLSQ